MPRFYRFLLLSILAALPCAATAQQWSYQGNSICYSYAPGSIQYYSQGTIQQYANSQQQLETQFRAGYEMGQVAGDLVGKLLQKWAERRQRINAERNDLRTQVRAYSDASSSLRQELIVQETIIAETCTRLADLVPSERDSYLGRAKQSRGFVENFRNFDAASAKNTAVILGAKDLKFLRDNVAVYKRSYEMSYQMAGRAYVYANLMQALLGFYESRATTPNP